MGYAWGMPYPSKRTPELVEQVLSRIAEGETLASLGRELDFTPVTFHSWMSGDEALRIAYQRARDAGADAIAEQCLALADEEPERFETEQGMRRDPGHTAWKRLQIDTRLKLLAKWNPKRYGENIRHEVEQTIEVRQSLTPQRVIELTNILAQRRAAGEDITALPPAEFTEVPDDGSDLL